MEASSSESSQTMPAESSGIPAAESSSAPSPFGSEPPAAVSGVDLPIEESVLFNTPETENKKKRRRSSGGASRMNVHSPLDPHTGFALI